jgi:cytochrome c oxidase subunit 3
MWIGLGGVVMVFAAFTSALVVRKGLGGDWRPFDLPGILWVSTAVLLASSFSIEKARRWMWRRHDQGLQRWMSVTGLLGAAFLASQLLAWRELADRGIYLASNPSSSFFYLLTAAHGVHLLGGIMAMSYVLYRLWRRRDWVTREAAVEATALYWHFMDGLWVYLLVLLMVWR